MVVLLLPLSSASLTLASGSWVSSSCHAPASTDFWCFDWWHRRDEALRRLAEWQLAGKIRFKEDVLEGIERMPEAFLRLLHGKNFGKQIVKDQLKLVPPAR